MIPARYPSLLSRLGRGLLFLAVLCTAIALFLTLIDGRPYAKFVYSFSIGICCWVMIDVMRLLVSHWLRRRQRLSGVAPPGPQTFELGWAGMAPLIVAGAIFGPPLGLAIGDALTGGSSHSYWDLSSKGTQVTLAISLLATLVTVLIRSAQGRAAAMQPRAEAAQRQAAETQLRLLQSQLEPHMLFNTLANLRVLIGAGPGARAGHAGPADRLPARHAGRRRDATPHPLADEFARVADYLALMAVRMGPRLRVALDLPRGAGARCRCRRCCCSRWSRTRIKHGLEPQVAGGRIEVRAARRRRGLRLRVRDTGARPGAAPTPRPTAPRFGLQQVRERLRTLYGDRATLDAWPAPQGRHAGRVTCRAATLRA